MNAVSRRLFCGMFLTIGGDFSQAEAQQQRGGCLSVGSGLKELSDGSVGSISLRMIDGHLAELQRAARSRVAINSGFLPDSGTVLAGPSCGGPSHRLRMDPRIAAGLQARGVPVLRYVLAHELAHFLQYEASPQTAGLVCEGRLPSSRTILMELLADFCAGQILAQLGEDRAVGGLQTAVALLADYEFANPEHHGTVAERSNALNFGALAARHGFGVDMARLIKNEATFRRHLGGPPARSAPQDLERWFKRAVEDVFR